MMHRLVLVAILLSMSVTGWAGESGLKIQPDRSVGVNRTTGKRIVSFSAYIVNVSDKPIKVLAAIPKGSVTCILDGDTTNDSLTHTYELRWEKDPKRRIVPSEVDLKPVVLYPGERTQMRISLLPGTLVGRDSMTLVYKVAPEWGKRFGAWSGTVESNKVPLD